MNANAVERAIYVMRAYLKGAAIQCRDLEDVQESPLQGWENLSCPGWDWSCYDYRVKPRRGEWWLFIDDSGRVLQSFNHPDTAAAAYELSDKSCRLVHAIEQE